MSVEAAYHELFAVDYASALRAASHAGDLQGRRLLEHLVVQYFDVELGEMPADKLIQFLSSAQVWRAVDRRAVYKTTNEPCLAFTATRSGERITLLALGICYRYPQSNADVWWRGTILSRL